MHETILKYAKEKSVGAKSVKTTIKRRLLLLNDIFRC